MERRGEWSGWRGRVGALMVVVYGRNGLDEARTRVLVCVGRNDVAGPDVGNGVVDGAGEERAGVVVE